MRIRDIVTESLADWTTGRWVHYTDFEMMRLNLGRDGPGGRSHQDPIGIYFFPEGAEAMPTYRLRKYRVTAQMALGARILDVASITQPQLDALVDACGCRAEYEAYQNEYPKEDITKRFDMAWEVMQRSIGAYGRGAAAWNKAIRACGWDAIFDDSGAIHSREAQLLVLNPSIIRNPHTEPRRGSGFAEVERVLADLKRVCAPYGEVTAEPVRRRKGSWGGGPTLAADLVVRRGEDNYARFTVSLDLNDRHQQIHAALNYSIPRLGYGVGVTFLVGTGEYQFEGMERLTRDLDKIFAQETETV